MTETWKPGDAVRFALLGVVLFAVAEIVVLLADVSLFGNWQLTGALTIVYAAPFAYGLSRSKVMTPIVAVLVAISICLAHAAAIYGGTKIVSDVFGGGGNELATYVRVGGVGGLVGALVSFVALALLVPVLRRAGSAGRLAVGVVQLGVLGAAGLAAVFVVNQFIEVEYGENLLLQALSIAVLHHFSWQFLFSWLIVSAITAAQRR